MVVMHSAKCPIGQQDLLSPPAEVSRCGKLITAHMKVAELPNMSSVTMPSDSEGRKEQGACMGRFWIDRLLNTQRAKSWGD